MVRRLESEQSYPAGGPRGKTRTALLADVDQSWQRPEVYQEQTRSARGESDAAPLKLKLDEIILPQVSFTQVEIGRVVSALASISQEFDPATTSVKGVNIVLLDPSDEKPTVTLTLRNTSLKRVLDFVTQSVGYQYEVQSDAVVVRPGGGARIAIVKCKPQRTQHRTIPFLHPARVTIKGHKGAKLPACRLFFNKPE